MTTLAPEWVQTRDSVIRSPARYRWTTAPADIFGSEYPKTAGSLSDFCLCDVLTINCSGVKYLVSDDVIDYIRLD